MINLKTLLSLIALIFLVACTTGGDEPASEPEATKATDVKNVAGVTATTPPLKEVTPMNPTSTPKPTSEQLPVDPTDTPQPEPSPEDDASSNSGVETGSASPVEVDLSQVTSQPPEDSSPQEAPRPGIPDPKVATAHQVSQDLAARLGVDVSDVEIVNVEEVEWSDGSLGCPAPGMMYITVITPGYLITLEVNGDQYSYHTDHNRNFVLCGDDGQLAIP